MTKKMDKILQNPLKSHGFVWISRFWCDIARISPILWFYYGFESLNLYKVAKSWISGFKSRFWQQWLKGPL